MRPAEGLAVTIIVGAAPGEQAPDDREYLDHLAFDQFGRDLCRHLAAQLREKFLLFAHHTPPNTAAITRANSVSTCSCRTPKSASLCRSHASSSAVRVSPPVAWALA